MRILWHSNAPWVSTGYGAQTRLFAPRVAALGHDVAISAYWGLNGAVFEWQGMAVYPGDEQWGNRLLPALAEQHHADLVLTLLDVWALQAKKLDGLRLACWVPVDHEPCPPKVLAFLRDTGARPIAMSRFGERMLTQAGLDPLYVPHGVDTTVYRPKPGRAGTRERMGIPAGAFVVGMVAANKGANPPRKAFPQVLEAFAALRREHPDAYLYLHCDPVGSGPARGVNLVRLAEQLDIPDDAIRFTSSLQLELGVPASEMADLYGAFDVLANPSYGEGFGVPIIEALACGVPVIVTDGTAMRELCGAGWLVQGEKWLNAPQRSWYTCPSTAGILDAMRAAYKQRGDEEMAGRARTFALDYDADRIVREHWTPALKALAAPSRVPVPA